MARLTAPSLMGGADFAEFLARQTADHGKFRTVSIATPYFTEPGLDRLLGLLAAPKEGGTKLQLLVRSDILSIATKTLSLDALRRTLNRPVREGSTTAIRWMPQLHAKMYLLEPRHICAVGSSNLTAKGLDGGNDELNAVWERSPNSFAAVKGQFERLWDDAKPLDEGTLGEWKGLTELPTLKALSRAFDRAQALTELPIFSEDGKNHKSYQVLQRLANRTKAGAKWSKIVQWLTGKSKGDKRKEKGRKLEALALSGLLRLEGEEVTLTIDGQKVAKDPHAAYDWLKREDPLVERVRQQVANQDGVSYGELVQLLSADKLKIERCMWWLSSLRLVRKTGGGGLGGEARWYPVSAGDRTTKRRQSIIRD